MKTKIPLGTSLLKNDQKNFLKSQFPFLENEYRKLLLTEIDSSEVWKELFGDIPYVDGYLKAIYFYQN